MTGVPSYSTTASENVQSNTGINWDEGMSPAAVNNSARQNMADMRAQWNDAAWFQYGTGSKTTVIPVYVSGTSFKVAGIDVTAYWHVGRRVKAVGTGTGTIYGTISASAFSTDTTLTVVWDSGSLSNEALTIYASIIPVTGSPVPQLTVVEGTGSAVAIGGSFTNVALVALTPGRWRISATYTENGTSAGDDQVAISTTNNSNSGSLLGKTQIGVAVSSNGRGAGAFSPFDVTVTVNTTYYLNASTSGVSSPAAYAYMRAEKIYGN